jgi:hypothetical protein
MPPELQHLLAPILLAFGLAACLWLCLNSKAEFRSRERALERRVNLLEERMENIARPSPPPKFPPNPLSPGFSYEVNLGSKLLQPPEPAPILIPEQLEFLSSLRSRPSV